MMYQKMYEHLFNSVSKAIDILEQAQMEAEEMYLEYQEKTFVYRPAQYDEQPNARKLIDQILTQISPIK